MHFRRLSLPFSPLASLLLDLVQLTRHLADGLYGAGEVEYGKQLDGIEELDRLVAGYTRLVLVLVMVGEQRSEERLGSVCARVCGVYDECFWLWLFWRDAPSGSGTVFAKKER